MRSWRVRLADASYAMLSPAEQLRLFSGREGDPAASGQVLPFRTTRNGQFHLRPRTASCQAEGFSTARGLRSDDADHHHHHSGCSNSHTNQALTVGQTLLCFIGISSFNQQPLY